jgi:glycosyltransferase involved in cell wall biosynthesis
VLPRVATITPVYNRRTLVLDALEAIAAQTHPPAAMIVVDDGSDDGTPDQIEEWLAARDLPYAARLIRAPHANVSVARNRGVAEAAGCDVLAFLDSDDLWPPDYLHRVARAFQDRPDAVATCCDMEVTDFEREDRRLLDFSIVPERATPFFTRRGPMGLSSTAMRARAFADAGGFEPDLTFAEDYLLELRLSLRGTWIHLPGRPVTYRLRLGETRGEEASLAFADRRPRLAKARILERFLVDEGGHRAVPDSIWRRALARAWFKAGQETYRAGERAESRACFTRGIALKPFGPRLRYWRLRCRVRDLRSRT